jgi:large subunit ribosomal protein L17
MRHNVSRLRLSKRPALAAIIIRNLATSVILYESVRTTQKRAKVVQPVIDRLIATAKRSDPKNAIRAINRVVTHPNASKKIMEVLVKRFANRRSGFTSIKPVGSRKGDGAALVDFMLMDPEAPKSAEKEATATSA